MKVHVISTVRKLCMGASAAVLVAATLPFALVAPVSATPGGRIYFSNDSSPQDIISVNPDGSDPIVIGQGVVPDISPDGTKIAYVWDSDVYVMNIDGTGVTDLTPNGSTPDGHIITDTLPYWSPDGTKIAFWRTGRIPSGTRGTYIINADGTNEQLVAPNATYAQWSPDGTKLVAQLSTPTGVRIGTMNVDGTNQVLLTSYGTSDQAPSWSPDGNWIAWVHNCLCGQPNEVTIMHPDGTGMQSLVQAPAGGDIQYPPAWSLDSSTLAFLQYPGPGGPSPLNYHLFTINISGGTAQDIYSALNGIISPSWGPGNANAAPVLDPLNAATINEGGTYSANGSFSDPDSNSWAATVDYGDGTGAQPLTLTGTQFSLSHIYPDNNNYTVTVSVTDDHATTSNTSSVVTVVNLAPTVVTTTAAPNPVVVNGIVTAASTLSDAGVLDTHTGTWNWGDGTTVAATIVESNGSGTSTATHSYVNPGTYTITFTATDNNGASGQKTTQVTAAKQLTALAPAKVWIGPSGLQDLWLGFDLKAEVYVNGNLVTTGQVASQSIGFGIFGQFTDAQEHTVTFPSFAPVFMPAGSQLSIKLSARNACSGSLRTSGTLRLWLNDNQATSRFGATIGTASTYYLRSGSTLATTAGPGPKQSIDIAAGAQCSTFKTFGTWVVTP